MGESSSSPSAPARRGAAGEGALGAALVGARVGGVLVLAGHADVEAGDLHALGLERAAQLGPGLLEDLGGLGAVGGDGGHEAVRGLAQAHLDPAELGRVQRELRLDLAAVLRGGAAWRGRGRRGRAASGRARRRRPGRAPRARPAGAIGAGSTGACWAAGAWATAAALSSPVAGAAGAGWSEAAAGAACAVSAATCSPAGVAWSSAGAMRSRLGGGGLFGDRG